MEFSIGKLSFKKRFVEKWKDLLREVVNSCPWRGPRRSEKKVYIFSIARMADGGGVKVSWSSVNRRPGEPLNSVPVLFIF